MCNKPTNGIFNEAKSLLERIKSREAQAEKSENEEDLERKAILDEYKEKQRDINARKYQA